MPKKVAATLIDLNAKQFAILLPGVGYFKNQWGHLLFEDKLPRASGCFPSKEAAIEARDLLIGQAQHNVNVAIRNDDQYKDPTYWIKQAQERLKYAQTAAIVEISLKQVS